jgi:hypothetical protein
MSRIADVILHTAMANKIQWLAGVEYLCAYGAALGRSEG